MIKKYNKLVRDRIPEIIETSGNTCVTEILSDEDYLRMLDAKLDEELAEYHADQNIEELADLMEVIRAVVKARGFSLEELEAIRSQKAAQRGGFEEKIFLMEVKTGEIKAICNLDRGSDEQYYELANHAVERVEPGSTFKTIALMAAMDDGKINIDDSVQVWRNGWKYHSVSHHDAHPADTIYSVRQALAVSSNIALAQIVTNSYDGSAK
jgi:predicted house-cleaning noncanonical NTP pyrophosphatase (MazG superfamily)